jgi:hypothetical protein
MRHKTKRRGQSSHKTKTAHRKARRAKKKHGGRWLKNPTKPGTSPWGETEAGATQPKPAVSRPGKTGRNRV